MVTDPSMRSKHAFVTGATGIVGSPLCKKLAETGVHVTTYSRSAAAADIPAGVEHVQGDILDRELLAGAADGADVIFHVAAAVHGSASTFDDFERMNVQGTENVVRAARNSGARLIHVSTVNVEGFRRGTVSDAYAVTKALGEDLVLAAVDDGLDAVIIRPATVFGSEPGRAGLIVDRLLAGSLKVLPAPSRRISPVWAGDLAVALINAGALGEPGQIYTVAGPAVSTKDFVASVSRSAGVPGPYLSIPAWVIAVPLQLVWWGRGITRWTPPFSVESLLADSVHDGSRAAVDLNFAYTPISEIFGGTDDRPAMPT